MFPVATSPSVKSGSLVHAGKPHGDNQAGSNDRRDNDKPDGRINVTENTGQQGGGDYGRTGDKQHPPHALPPGHSADYTTSKRHTSLP